MFRMATLLGLPVWRVEPRTGACLGERERAKVSAIKGENAPCSSLRHPQPFEVLRYATTHAHETRLRRNGFCCSDSSACLRATPALESLQKISQMSSHLCPSVSLLIRDDRGINAVQNSLKLSTVVLSLDFDLKHK